MKVDGLNLIEGSSITNAAIASGPSFPSSPDGGELFYINSTANSNVPGLYFYDAINIAWTDIVSGGNFNDFLTVTPTAISYGVAFPGTPVNGEVFYLTGAISGYAAGLYYYDEIAVDWQVASSAGGSSAWASITGTPTTISGYGITDAQALDADLTAIAALAGTSGILTKTAANTWSLDTNTYLTAHPSVSGATSVDNSGLTYIQDLTFDANGHVTGQTSAAIQSASIVQEGVVQLTNSTATTSSTLAASATAVKAAYDLAASALANPGGTFSGNIVIPTGYHITITDAPVSGTDATNKNYVDANLAGLSWKQAVKVATTANITLSGTQTIDGVAVVASDRVLVKDQSTASANGIYVVAAGAWTRALDMDATTPVNELNSAAVFVEQGTINADSGWTQINNISTLGSDTVSFTQFNGSAGVTAGVGLVKTGNVLDVNLGAGVSQLPTDEVGIDLYTGGGLMLTVDGTASSTLTAAQLSLTKVGTAGTYKSVTTDDFGRVTAGSNPTTLSGYGITDAQALDADLTAIAALAGTSGILTKTAANTWALDTATYLTSLTDTLSSVTGRGATTPDAITLTNATASTSTSTGALIVSGGVGVAGAVTAANLSVANGTVTSATLTTSATTPSQVVSSLSATAYRSVAYQIQVTSGSSYHTTQILAIHDGTTVSLTEFATIFTGVSLATFDADISGGNIRLLVTPTNAVSTIKVIETAINI